jgi:hypothetical protein
VHIFLQGVVETVKKLNWVPIISMFMVGWQFIAYLHEAFL